MFLFTSMSWQFHFHLPPVAFNLVRVKSLVVDKFNGMVYSLMNIAVFPKVRVRLPAVRNNDCAWCDPLLIKFKSVSSVLFSTVSIKDLRESSSMPPKTHWPSTTCPLWYFLFPILLSSICTSFPGPPIFSRFSKSVTSHTSLQNMSQSTAACDPIPSCFFICY